MLYPIHVKFLIHDICLTNILSAKPKFAYRLIQL